VTWSLFSRALDRDICTHRLVFFSIGRPGFG
jgi:hypothetical protein